MRRGRETKQRAGSAKDGGRDAAAAAGGDDDQGGELAAAASPSRQGFAFLHPEEDGGHRARRGARTSCSASASTSGTVQPLAVNLTRQGMRSWYELPLLASRQQATDECNVRPGKSSVCIEESAGQRIRLFVWCSSLNQTRQYELALNFSCNKHFKKVISFYLPTVF